MYGMAPTQTSSILMRARPMKITHRPARPDDANRLFELRRSSITALAVRAMPMADANSWAASLTLAGMQQKLRELEVWVSEAGGTIVGWGAIRGDRLEGLYTGIRCLKWPT